MVVLPRVLAVIVLLALAIGITRVMIASGGSAEIKPPRATSIVVRTIGSVHRPADRVWSGYGTARTMSSADIVAEVSGRVIERPPAAEPGRRIESGDLIVRLDDTDYINALDSARQAALSLEAQIRGLAVESEQIELQVQYANQEIEAAKRDLSRVDEVIAKGVGNQGERDVKLSSLLRAQRELSVLRQQLDLIPSRRSMLGAELSAQRAGERIASQNVERSVIRAPFSGELQSVSPRVGGWVAMGSSIARIVDLSRLEIPLKVAASASSWVRVGDEARLWAGDPSGDPDRIGKVMRIAPEADSSSRTMTIYVEVEQDPDDPGRMLPGQFVQGRILTHDPHERVILPRRAVQSQRVLVASEAEGGGRVIESMPVRVAYSFEAALPEIDPVETQWVALEIGHEPVEHARVVVSLLDQLIEGMRVRLAEGAEPGSAPAPGPEPAPEQRQDAAAPGNETGGTGANP